ncbi:MAG TPA: hypothetical protein VHA82_00375, partial [Ramlibacter sp.]|uniref:hypothetical protein n=1 Tax=Ramlibacter sp. TaxID=1917967 RepID=UPI002C11F474
MVAIVSGNTLGLGLTSLATLGEAGVTGQAASGSSSERAYVNVANGNLIVQDEDERLKGVGIDGVALRTYNSLGALDDDNADNWSTGTYTRNLTAAGPPNTAGSTVMRTAPDGAQALYAWDATAQLYRSTAGAGAYDTIAYDAPSATYSWSDGASGATEKYRAVDGRLLWASDARGNT